MFSGIFKRKDIYIALLILSLLLFVGSAAYILLTPAGFAAPTQAAGFDGEQMVEGFGGEGAEFPAMPEGFGGEGFQPPSMPEGFDGEDGAQFPAMPEGFGGGEGAEFSAMPEGFGVGSMPSAAMEQGPAAFLLSLVKANLPVVIIAALSLFAAVFSIIMLVRIGRRNKRQREMDADDEVFIHKKKSGTGPYIFVLVALLALFIALLPEPADTSDEAQVQEELIEAAVEKGNITRTLVAAGSISESNVKSVRLAGDIKVQHWYIENGDYVQAGQVIAELDRDSVILAIAELTELMAQIDADINTSLNDVISNSIYAPASGRIKTIYAQPGVKVQDTMAEHSTLMRLSLDGLMAADIEAGENVQSGMAVTVQLSDGSLIDGSVETVFDGVAVVVMSDEKAAYGEKVCIYDAQGTQLGEAELYIHKEVKISGLGGTVQRLNVEENMLVGTDMALVVLTDTAYRGHRDILTEQRREMEEELTKLFEAYNSGQIVSPCNGRVAAINEDIVLDELAGGDNGGFELMLLAEGGPSLESYGVSVSKIEEGLFTLSYSDGLSQNELVVDLSSTVVFKYVNGNYMPGSYDEIKVGDSLLLSCYVSGGSTVLDHVVLFSYSNQNGAGGGQGTQGGSSMGGSSMGGSSMGGSSMGGSGMSGGSMSGMTLSDTGTEDAYSIPRTILSYIYPFDEAQIDITVDELDISAYRIGQSVSVSLDALPGQSFTATVRAIDPNGVNDDGGNTKYTVTVAMPRTENMLSGMNASVRLECEQRQEVLMIPLAAICEESGRIFVYTSYDAETDLLGTEVEIETGLSDGEMVEIVSGLEAGDSCFYRYADTIRYAFQQ